MPGWQGFVDGWHDAFMSAPAEQIGDLKLVSLQQDAQLREAADLRLNADGAEEPLRRCRGFCK